MNHLRELREFVQGHLLDQIIREQGSRCNLEINRTKNVIGGRFNVLHLTVLKPYEFLQEFVYLRFTVCSEGNYKSDADLIERLNQKCCQDTEQQKDTRRIGNLMQEADSISIIEGLKIKTRLCNMCFKVKRSEPSDIEQQKRDYSDKCSWKTH